MPAGTQIGNYAIAWPLVGGVTFTLAGSARLLGVENASIQHAAERIDTADGDGDLQNATFFNTGKIITMRVYPRGSSKANASTVMRNPPVPGTICLLATSNDAALNSLTDTNIGSTAGTTYFSTACTTVHERGRAVGFDVTLERRDSIATPAVVT